MIMPLVTIGLIPNSISVPRFDARMTRIQNRGSDESDDMIPYNGTCEQTKKMQSVTAVHSTFWLKGTWSKFYEASDGPKTREYTLFGQGKRPQEGWEGKAGRDSRTGLFGKQALAGVLGSNGNNIHPLILRNSQRAAEWGSTEEVGGKVDT